MSDTTVPPSTSPPVAGAPSGNSHGAPDPAAWNKAVAEGATSVLGGMMMQMLNNTKSNGEEGEG